MLALRSRAVFCLILCCVITETLRPPAATTASNTLSFLILFILPSILRNDSNGQLSTNRKSWNKQRQWRNKSNGRVSEARAQRHRRPRGLLSRATDRYARTERHVYTHQTSIIHAARTDRQEAASLQPFPSDPRSLIMLLAFTLYATAIVKNAL